MHIIKQPKFDKQYIHVSYTDYCFCILISFQPSLDVEFLEYAQLYVIMMPQVGSVGEFIDNMRPIVFHGQVCFFYGTKTHKKHRSLGEASQPAFSNL